MHIVSLSLATYELSLFYVIDLPSLSLYLILSRHFSGDTVFIQGAAATPTKLVAALAKHGKEANLQNVQTCSMHTEGGAEYTAPELEKTFRSVSFFMGGNVRKAVAEGRADAVPIFLHEIPKLFHQKIYRPDVALISVSLKRISFPSSWH